MEQIEIIYYTKAVKDIFSFSDNIRWLTPDDYEVFCTHLKLCGQHSISRSLWDAIYTKDTVYCGLFVNGKMVSRACVEKYSPNAWEVADVRTAAEHRGSGYAREVCRFVLNYIISWGKTATIRTEEDNFGMKKVISELGFSVL